MANLNKHNLLSFNCFSVKNKLPIIKNMCDSNDIVFLQETWLMPHELGLLDNIHKDFNAHSISSVDVHSAVHVGRPHGGLSILWRKDMDSVCNIVNFDDHRILGIMLTRHNFKFLLINVYLPFYSDDNYPEYLMYLGKIAHIVDTSDVHGLLVCGDFNADINKEFYTELYNMCCEKDLTICDVDMLPADTYTHVNNGNLCRSWLDHCVASSSIRDAIDSIHVDYNYCGSDHLPIKISFNMELPKLDYIQDAP